MQKQDKELSVTAIIWDTTAFGKKVLLISLMYEAFTSHAAEELKMTDQLRWVGMMNAIKHQAEEIIWNEVVYK